MIAMMLWTFVYALKERLYGMPLTLKCAEWTGERSQWVKLDDEQVGTAELERDTEQHMSVKDSPTHAQRITRLHI